MINDTTILFEKKLGACYLLELKQYNKENKLVITLYKKWEKHLGYENTDNVLEFNGNDKREREKALSVFNRINLKTLKKYFNWSC